MVPLLDSRKNISDRGFAQHATKRLRCAQSAHGRSVHRTSVIGAPLGVTRSIPADLVLIA